MIQHEKWEFLQKNFKKTLKNSIFFAHQIDPSPPEIGLIESRVIQSMSVFFSNQTLLTDKENVSVFYNIILAAVKETETSEELLFERG